MPRKKYRFFLHIQDHLSKIPEIHASQKKKDKIIKDFEKLNPILAQL